MKKRVIHLEVIKRDLLHVKKLVTIYYFSTAAPATISILTIMSPFTQDSQMSSTCEKILNANPPSYDEAMQGSRPN